jgi:hypothetical protein
MVLGLNHVFHEASGGWHPLVGSLRLLWLVETVWLGRWGTYSLRFLLPMAWAVSSRIGGDTWSFR